MRRFLTTLSILLVATTVCASQTIWVKYRDTPVDLDYFEYQDTSESSWINGTWYDGENDYLIINLKGINYHYCGSNFLGKYITNGEQFFHRRKGRNV